MKKYLLILLALVSFSTADAQITKKVKKFFKYSTVYGVAGQSQPQTDPARSYFVNQDGALFDITPDAEPNYSYGFGIRKVARFDYENKPNAFYDGTEIQTGLSSNVGAVKGWEYKFQWEWARQFGNEYTKEDIFLRYLGKNYIFKVEQLQDGLADLDYRAIDIRWRKPIGKKLNLSIGAAFRTHRPYGYNPIRDYLDDEFIDDNGNTRTRYWWELAYEYGYQDNGYGIDLDFDGVNDEIDYYWTNADGERVSDTDLDFRTNVFGGIVNDYNRSQISLIDDLGTISPVIGLDFYHYSDDGNNWVHAWTSVMPYHKQIMGEEDFSYQLWNDGKQWTDFTLGAMTGWKITKKLGIFAEVNYLQYWDRQVYVAKAGLNFQFR